MNWDNKDNKDPWVNRSNGNDQDFDDLLKRFSSILGSKSGGGNGSSSLLLLFTARVKLATKLPDSKYLTSGSLPALPTRLIVLISIIYFFLYYSFFLFLLKVLLSIHNQIEEVCESLIKNRYIIYL